MTIYTLFLVTVAASLTAVLLAPVAKRACSHILSAALRLKGRWRQRLRARRNRREYMRSLGDWIESIRLQFWFREFATGEMKKTLEETDRDLSHAHGIPYWKLHVCERMGWTRLARAAATSASTRSMTSCWSRAPIRSLTRWIAVTEVRRPSTADPTSPTDWSFRPALSAATRAASASVRNLATDLLIRNSTVTSLSFSARDAMCTTQRVGDVCSTDAM